MLGCFQYYSRFIPDFTIIAEPLFSLQTAKDFIWNSSHLAALQQLKLKLSSNPILRPFSPALKSTVITDASPVGLGAILEQDGYPVICISRRLSSAERGYSQTQREALAVFWAIKRLHKFLFGIQFHLVTDHQALKFIFAPDKSISRTSTAMVNRWAIQLSAYNYTIEYRSGKLIPHADFLSRYSAFENYKNNSFLIQPLPISRSELANETRKYYSDLLSAIRHGWKNIHKKKYHQMYTQRNDISVSPDKILSIGDRMIIPPTLRKAVLQDLHSGHLGSDKMKSLARLTCWWPEINSDIINYSKECDKCMHKDFHKPSDWRPWPIPYDVWQRVHIDFCGPFLNKYYALVLIDSYSKWPEVFLTTHATSTFTIRALKKCFSREGIPQTLVSDNGTPFIAAETTNWLRSIGCRHVLTPPRHPQSNGAAENFVKNLKSAIHSSNPSTFEQLDATIDNFLLQYRNAVHLTSKHSPAMLFKKRNLRANLKCIDTTDVIFHKGNEYEPSNGIILKQLGNRMVQIMDTTDASCHRRHIDQIHFRNSNNSESKSLSDNCSSSTSKEIVQEQPHETLLRRSERTIKPPKYFINNG
jgi:transposase InsO family protein